MKFNWYYVSQVIKAENEHLTYSTDETDTEQIGRIYSEEAIKRVGLHLFLF